MVLYRKLFLQVFSICLVFYLLANHSSCTNNRSGEAEQYASLDTSTHYVGMETCRQCHSDIYNSYIRTGMGKSFDLASREKSSADFQNHPLIHDPENNFNYLPFWKGDDLYIREFRLQGKDTVYVQEEQIHYIVGSGQHTNSHITSHNDYLYQAPATYYTQEGRWDLPPGFEKGRNSRFSRKIEAECITCHNAYPVQQEGSSNKFLSVPNGIDCERCHGPGSKHVEDKRSGRLIDTSKYIDYSIVNPAKLPVSLQLDVCQRCHIQGNAVLQEGKSFYDFRPGMKLSDVMNVYMPAFSGDPDAHIMASHAERMKMSKCFIESRNQVEANPVQQLRPYKSAMTCVSCHNPHVSVLESGKNHFNAACQSCHSKNSNSHIKVGKKECSADPLSRKKKEDNCVSCHMPKNNTLDIPHVTATDHYIRKPVSVSEKQKINEFIGLLCINNSNPDSFSVMKAYLNYFEKFVGKSIYLDSAARYLPKGSDYSLEKFRQEMRLYYLREDFPGMIYLLENQKQNIYNSLKSDPAHENAWFAYRVGVACAALQQLNKALQYFKRAVELAPYELDFRIRYADALADAGNTKEAKIQYEWVLGENPKQVKALINLGYLLLSVEQNFKEADRLYAAALALDPDNRQALLNRAGSAIYLGEIQSAKSCLERLLKLDPGHVQAGKLLLQIRQGKFEAKK